MKDNGSHTDTMLLNKIEDCHVVKLLLYSTCYYISSSKFSNTDPKRNSYLRRIVRVLHCCPKTIQTHQAVALGNMLLRWHEHTHCSLFRLNPRYTVLMLQMLYRTTNVDSSAAEGSFIACFCLALTDACLQ